ncbi:unnamed protein product [Cochlearia groenlandica]
MSHHPNNQLLASVTKPELSGLENHKKPISGVFISDYESAWSPTSPLDLRLFSSLGNPFDGSSSSLIRKAHQKSWDSGKVGLSIVDSLDVHHTDSSMSPPDSKNMIFGSWMRKEDSKCLKPHHVVEDFHVLSLPFVEVSMHKDDELASVKDNAFEVIKQTQGPVSGHSKSDIEISEDYTCGISHGPDPKTTRFYGDRVMELLEHNGKKTDCCESIFTVAPLDLTTVTDVLLPSNDFLSFCCACRKKLGVGKDIYIYRGDKAFCSSECRAEVIHLDEEIKEEEEDEAPETCGSSSDKDLPKKKSNGVIFTVG